MADLSVEFAGMHFPNPFLLASAPPTRTGEMIRRAFAAGWGGAVTKSIALDPARDLQPRLHPLRYRKRAVGMENVELTTQLTVEQWQQEIADVKAAYPSRPLWASIMDAPVKENWQRLAEAMQEAGADALELNVSCPHGMPTKGMGAFIGQNAQLTGEVVSWVKEVSQVPVVVKLTPNVTDIAFVARAAKENGADALCAINTVLGLIGVDLDTLTPLPSVGGVSTYGGYSGPGVKPIALRCVAQIAKATGLPVSGPGGPEHLGRCGRVHGRRRRNGAGGHGRDVEWLSHHRRADAGAERLPGHEGVCQSEAADRRRAAQDCRVPRNAPDRACQGEGGRSV